ncbi:orotidine-5'-phosphate decarboxylase [Alkalihalobacillus sp. AL-G]|uniref:orotidine-5'-phosphate decarboxylase n=1 Tax=Alkalihalobacillus sp. AL-G TaxID=2926399 RepID=UPI00272D4DE4|nr:orotidine-5'-phosphate decarboxylase [Alkalihalobacillus sp. AL-G]WLD95378.1 orotidine-5'-phosphate decarboxylase [Alkalihalobacillus sp. AL-G]
MLQPVIIALDFSTRAEVEGFLQPFSDEQLFLKVGMELYYQEGPDLVNYLQSQGHAVFLDLKLHDIPTTVYKAMRGIANLGVDLINVHAAGGIEMMKKAIEGLEDGSVINKRPLCIAVTQLTSTSVETMNEELNIPGTIQDTVEHYAKNAEKANLDGVVCSPLEVPFIRDCCGERFLTITPGIRLANNDVNDQKRIASPVQAKELGSSCIVVGRTITRSEKPVIVYHQILDMWRKAE